MNRASGVLLPIFSLPSNVGIGNFGQCAYKFIDLLKDASQKYWQILPLNPIDSSNSPYFSISHFAGESLFIDLESLIGEGLIDDSDIKDLIDLDNPHKIDYGFIKKNYDKVFKKAYTNFIKSNYNKVILNSFILRYDTYIKDYVLFKSMKSVFDKPFVEWENIYKFYNVENNKRFQNEYRDLVEYNYFLQYLFFKQWLRLKKYANAKGISIIGDMPIYSSNDSSDVWANSKNYMLDDNLLPTEVAGCPPDAFNDNGQLWGNPLYNYHYMKENNFDYFMKKFSLLFKFYDVIRLDHFRGFESYYAIKVGAIDAKNGIWRKGPGMDLFNLLHKRNKSANIIAEDLGFITDEVKKLLNDTGYPGMKVMQFAFNHYDDPNNPYRPHNYIENCVAYLGTHDNDTFMGWYNSICDEDRNLFNNYVSDIIKEINPNVDTTNEITNLKDDKSTWAVYSALQVLYNSHANLVITNIQDILGIGSEGRINTPSTLSDNNWSFRFTKEQLFDKKVTKILSALTTNSNRCL